MNLLVAAKMLIVSLIKVRNLIFLAFCFAQINSWMNWPKIKAALGSLLVLGATHNELNDRQCNRNHALKKLFQYNGGFGSILAASSTLNTAFYGASGSLTKEIFFTFTCTFGRARLTRWLGYKSEGFHEARWNFNDSFPSKRRNVPCCCFQHQLGCFFFSQTTLHCSNI